MQKYNNNKKEERSEADWRGERKQEREWEWERKSHMSSWNDVPHSPRLRIPKYLVLEMWKPGARRTPFPREAPLVSLARETAGSSGVQTSAKRQAREMCTHCASFFSLFLPSFPLFSPSLPLSLSFFSLCVVFQTRRRVFYQINISQNKSQDNFKLVSEEKGGGKKRRRRGGKERESERERGRIWLSFARLLWSGVSVFLLTSFWGLWFCLFRLGVSSHLTDEVVTTAYECQMREHSMHPYSRGTFTYSLYHKQKSFPDLDNILSRLRTAILRTKAQKQHYVE